MHVVDIWSDLVFLYKKKRACCVLIVNKFNCFISYFPQNTLYIFFLLVLHSCYCFESGIHPHSNILKMMLFRQHILHRFSKDWSPNVYTILLKCGKYNNVFPQCLYIYIYQWLNYLRPQFKTTPAWYSK